MTRTDAIGRSTFHHIEYREGIRPTPREIRWLKHIERHGPQSSDYLFEATRDTHRDPDTARRQLRKLRAGRFLHCPHQQRATENAAFNPFIYDLTDHARDWLAAHGRAENTVRPRGHWVHGYMTACITGSIDIAAARAGIAYIPAHRILERAGNPIGTRIDGRALIPDQLFGLDYGGKYRFFCVEVDRGTEPKMSATRRKSYRSMLEAYRRFIGEGLYRPHYRLTAMLALLVVFSSQTNQRAFLELAETTMGEHGDRVLTRTITGFHGPFRPPPLLTDLFHGHWQRPGRSDVRIDRV